MQTRGGGAGKNPGKKKIQICSQNNNQSSPRTLLVALHTGDHENLAFGPHRPCIVLFLEVFQCGEF